MEQINYEKICSFYVSKSHLIVILLQYLKEKLKKDIELTVLTEDDFYLEIQKIINKTEIESNIKNKIEKEFRKKINKKAIKKIKGIVIVQGDYEYIKKVNIKLEKNKKIEIINCFKFEDFETKTNEILRSHYKILNTLGEKEISNLLSRRI